MEQKGDVHTQKGPRLCTRTNIKKPASIPLVGSTYNDAMASYGALPLLKIIRLRLQEDLAGHIQTIAVPARRGEAICLHTWRREEVERAACRSGSVCNTCFD